MTIVRYGDTGLADDMIVEQVMGLRGVRINFNAMRTVRSRDFDKSGGRVDVAGRTNADKQLALFQRLVDGIHMQRHFAKPDDIGTQAVVTELAALAPAVACEVVVLRLNRSAFGTTRAG